MRNSTKRVVLRLELTVPESFSQLKAIAFGMSTNEQTFSSMNYIENKPSDFLNDFCLDTCLELKTIFFSRPISLICINVN